MSLSREQVQEYRRLRDTGVMVEKGNRIRFNDGAGETAIHAASKMLVGLIALEYGYRVDSEVPIEDYQGNTYTTDVLIWGHEDRLTYSVELEHSPTREVLEQKVDQYVRNTSIDDLQLLNLNDSPHDIVDCYGWIGSELGLPVE